MNRVPQRNDGKAYNVILFLPFTVILTAIFASFFFFRCNAEEIRQYDMKRIEHGSYEGAFFSMYPIDHFRADDFTTFYAWTPVMSSAPISSMPMLSEYLNALFSSDNSVSHVCLGLDPYQIWQSCGGNMQELYEELHHYLLPYFDKNPSIHFYIILSYPSLDYYLSLKRQALLESLVSCRKLLPFFDAYENVRVYFPGAEEWLIANPANYEGDFLVNSLVSHMITAFLYSDQLLVSPANAGSYLNRLISLIYREQLNNTVYPDFSQMQMVFLGDSVIGNYGGSLSIPGVVAGLSNASVYNYAIGGTHATLSEEHDNSFLMAIDDFLAKQLPPSQDSPAFPYEEQTRSHKELCFLIHYGLNDYFNGYPVENPEDPWDVHTFSGALRTGIRKIREAYPEAHILLMTPPFCSYFSNGTEINQEGGGRLTDYVNAVVETAQSEDVLYMNNYDGLGINAENYETYLADGCHLNELGRFLLGYQIVFALQDALALQ